MAETGAMTVEFTPRHGLLEVGRVARSHGLKGDVLVSFTTDQIDARTAVGVELIIGDTPHVVMAARPHQKYQLVRFQEITDRNAADALRGELIFAEPLGETDDVFVHEVIGSRLVDQHETDHGTIVSVIDNPASDLLELADGRLVPFVFIVEHHEGVVRVDVPVGLLDDEAAETDRPS